MGGRCAAILAVLIAVITLAGCSEVVHGQAAPALRSGVLGIPGPDEAETASFAKVRELDPCGFIDLRAVGAVLSPPTWVGTDQKPSECEVKIDPTKNRERIASISVSPDVQLDDADVPALADSNFNGGGTSCSAAIPYQGERGLFFYESDDYNMFDSDSTPTQVDHCPSLKKIVAASLPLFTTRPLRATSTHVVNFQLARMDPCAISTLLKWRYPHMSFGTDGSTHRASTALSECDIWTDGYRRDDSDRIGVSLWYQDKDVTVHLPADPGAPPGLMNPMWETIRGVDSRVVPPSGVATLCEINSYVKVNDSVLIPFLSNESPQPMVETIQSTAHDCDTARIVADAAVRVYQRS
ncbi:hypothetical protein GCM10027169_28490 [Gordonia jinhuaensis]|uniref:DUF3558 domain-containing protein n=1 Tax=Gordonia jinhuaensis TaxID=1517702 RepID=A0A916TAG6_9ACTN|nr:hypothetical protein GCM10011489_25450 [Gordonia jinhuaensis]